MTGPITFSHRTARSQLVENGEVITFRKNSRTTGKTWWREERGGSKQGEVTVEEVGQYDAADTDSLAQYADLSGFDSVQDWQEAIKGFCGGDLPEGYLYRTYYEINVNRLGQQQKDILRFLYNGFTCKQKEIIQTIHGEVDNSRKASVSRSMSNLIDADLVKEVDEGYVITSKGEYFVENDKRFNIISGGSIPKEAKKIGFHNLKIDERNARITRRELDSLAESIEKVGLLNPLVVRQVPGEPGYSIIDGSRRLLAAERAGVGELSCVILYGIDDEQAISISLALNTNREELDEEAKPKQSVWDY